MKYLLILLATLSLHTGASTLSSIDDAKHLSESVMKDVGDNKMRQGIEKLRPHIVFPESELDVQISNLDMQMPIINQRFGKSIGYDFVEKETLGNSLVQYVYLQKFEKHVMVWRFIFYKPNDKWLFNTFYFNDQVKPLFRY